MKFLFISMAFLLASCSAENGDIDSGGHALISQRSQCSADGNSVQRPCQISFYDLFSGSLSGLFVVFVAYNPGEGASLVFVNQDAAEFEDYSSSVIVKGEGLPRDSGYIRVYGRFVRDDLDYGVGYPFSRQIGVVELTRPAVVMRSMEQRRRECDGGRCYVKYLDGDEHLDK